MSNSFMHINIISQKGKECTLTESIFTFEKIINSILNYTKKTFNNKQISSMFDITILSLQNDDTDSDSENEIITLDKIDLDEFIIRCINFLNFEHNSIVLSMMILDKILKKGFVLTEKNVHKMLFLIFMEVHKFYFDNTFSNKDYSTIGLIQVNDLLLLELEFLSIIDFNMYIDPSSFEIYNMKFQSFRKR